MSCNQYKSQLVMSKQAFEIRYNFANLVLIKKMIIRLREKKQLYK